MIVNKISETQLKITNEIIEYVDKKDLEEQKLALERRVLKITELLDAFKEDK